MTVVYPFHAFMYKPCNTANILTLHKIALDMGRPEERNPMSLVLSHENYKCSLLSIGSSMMYLWATMRGLSLPVTNSSLLVPHILIGWCSSNPFLLLLLLLPLLLLLLLLPLIAAFSTVMVWLLLLSATIGLHPVSYS
jgi:hypothetical protein